MEGWEGKERISIPVFKVAEVGRGAGVAADEGDAADGGAGGGEELLGGDDGADGVGAEVVVEV